MSFSDTINFRDGSLDRRMKQMENDFASQKREMRQLNVDAQRWRDRALMAEEKIQQLISYQPTIFWGPPPMTTHPQHQPAGPPESFARSENLGAGHPPGPGGHFPPNANFGAQFQSLQIFSAVCAGIPTVR